MTEILPMTEYLAEYTQQCLNCHEAIHHGDPVVAGAVNHFTQEPVWMHPRCARWYRLNFGTRAVVDDGWRILTFEQRCKGGCQKFITPGEKAYRLWTWRAGLSFTLDCECHACHRSRNGAVVGLPA